MISIKRLDISYLDELVDIRLDEQQDCWKDNFPCTEEEFKNATRKFLENNYDKDFITFGLLIDAELVSVCSINYYYLLPQAVGLDGKYAKIVNVYTKPEHRGKGYQQELFEHCLAFLREQDIRFVELKTLNEVARHIYKKFGFIDDDMALKIYLKGAAPKLSKDV